MSTFPLEWAIQENVVDKATKLNTFLENSEAIKAKIDTLKKEKHGANWLYFSIKNFQKTVPAALLEEVSQAAKIHIADISGDEKPDFVGKFEDLTQLDGLHIFEQDIRSVLIDNVLKPLIELESCDKEAQTAAKLNKYCRWVDTVDEQLALAEQILEHGRAFFSRSNIELFGSVINSKKEMYKLIEFQSQYK